MDEACGNKRGRCGEVEESPPESKRIRAELLFDILDDESEPDNTDLDSVMRSLEEEIALPVAVSDSDPGAASVSDPEPKQPDLGFLLEASDDELGLPPAEGDVTSGEATGGEENVSGEVVEEAGFGKIWGLDDEIHLDFGFGSDGGGDDGGVIFDGGLFEYDGGVCGPPDFSDLTWRPEYWPAVDV